MPSDFILDRYQSYLLQRGMSAESVKHYLGDAGVIIEFLRTYRLISDQITESAILTFLVNIEKLDSNPTKQRQYTQSAQMMVDFLRSPTLNGDAKLPSGKGLLKLLFSTKDELKT